MTFTVLYDANVLYPNVLRDVLIRLAQTGLVHARWTDRILDETFRNLTADRPDIPTATLAKLRELMNRAVPDCLVTGYEALIPALTLPDEDDRHVLAAAIRCSAQVIVTANLRDFPDNELAQFGIEALHPDEFVMDLFTLDGARVHQAISATAAAWRNPPALRPTSATASPRRAYRSPRLRCVAEIPRCAAHGLLFQKLYSYRCFETLFWNQLIRRRELGRLDPACTQDGCLTAKEVGRHSWAISWLCSVMLSQITAHTDTRAACGPRVGRILRAGLALPKGTRCVQPVIHEWHHAVCGAQRS